ncbi:cyclin-F-like [Ptychodera flava]|uniref:cyclin-F-like n=1 Tax=Ptychodera flava TaxID=63121 RepID=UPI00396A28F1
MREQRRNRVPRTRSTRSKYNIWCLPEEVQLLLFAGLPARDLLSVRAVHSKFRNLIDSNPSIWSTVHFHGEWPSPGNRTHFERAVEHNNIEAIIKLGVAYLYNEGISEDGKAANNSSQTSKYFCKAEALSPLPFTWLFIRPPWSASGTCCKAMVFNNMKNHCKTKASSSSTMYCIAKILSLFDDEAKQKEAMDWYQKASNHGSPHAALVTWKNAQSQNRLDPGCSLNSIRQLRECANNSCIDVKLTLFECYSKGQFGGLTKPQIAESISQLVKSSRPMGTSDMFFQQQNLNASMRYILIDWLVEVTDMKDFDNLTLHTAVRCIDRYLLLQPTTRSNLQLLGISAMVICSRLLEKDIITIREAAWLTDGTYAYEEVVRMIGEIVAVLHGQIRVPTVLDFLKLFCNLAAVDRQTEFLAQFLAEMTLLYTEFGSNSPATIAASAVFLSRMLLQQDFPWPSHMVEFTGYKVVDIIPCTLLLFRKCFVEPSLTDHRDVTLMAIKQRYSESDFMEVSKMEVMKYTELCSMLGAQSVLDDNSTREDDEPCHMDFLSPNKERMDQSELSKDRDSMVVTPFVELSEAGHDNSVLASELGNVSFDSVGTGYEGDQESEGEMEVDEEEWSMDTHDGLDEPIDISSELSLNTFSAILAVDVLSCDSNSEDTSNSDLSSLAACFSPGTKRSRQGPSPGSRRSYRINAGGKLSPCKGSVLQPVQNVYSGRLRSHSKGHQHKNVTQRQRRSQFGCENRVNLEYLS